MLREKGLELRSALQLRGKAEAKELPTPFNPSPYDAFFRRGNLLPSRNERSGLKRSDDSERSEAKVKGGDIALLTQSVAGFKFVFSWCGSRWVKFANLSIKIKAKYREMILRALLPLRS